MTDAVRALVNEYTVALADYLADPGEAPLRRAYEIGRSALVHGGTVLDLCAIHQEALLAVLPHSAAHDEASIIATRSTDFLMESLSPYAMNQLGSEETLAQIRERNRLLEERLAAIAAERQQAEDALRAAERQTLQAQKLRALGQMASGVAHDLNQSLGLIVGYGDLAAAALAQSPPQTAELANMLAIMSRAAHDGGETVRRLLTFSRHHDDNETKERVSIGALLREVAQLTAPRWRDAAQATGCRISLHVEAEPDIWIHGWPASLREAFTNLVFNAVDAMPEGGTILLRARRAAEGMVTVDVTDTGIGMTDEVRERVFEPFFTTKGERGTGLGLAHVFGVAERHGGHIAVQSSSGNGTTFRLTLAEGTASQQVISAAPEPPVPSDRLRVLVVDDEPALVNLASAALQRDGHAVVTASTGEEALGQLARQPFNLVMSDVGMGAGMNGWELADQVRQRWPQVRVVLATGWGAQIDLTEARARGVVAVIAKPYRVADLLKAVDTACGTRRSPTPT